MIAPRSIENARSHGYTCRLLARTVWRRADLFRWQIFDPEGRYLTEWLLVVNAEDCETVYWLTPSIRYSDDIEHLRRLSAEAAGQEVTT